MGIEATLVECHSHVMHSHRRKLNGATSSKRKDSEDNSGMCRL